MASLPSVGWQTEKSVSTGETWDVGKTEEEGIFLLSVRSVTSGEVTLGRTGDQNENVKFNNVSDFVNYDCGESGCYEIRLINKVPIGDTSPTFLALRVTRVR